MREGPGPQALPIAEGPCLPLSNFATNIVHLESYLIFLLTELTVFMILSVGFSRIWSPVSQKPRHDRFKPRSHGVRGKTTSRAPHGYVHLVACAGIDRIRTGNQDTGTQRQRSAEKSWSRRDHQNQTGSTGLNIMARRSTGRGRQQQEGRTKGQHEACRGRGPQAGLMHPRPGQKLPPGGGAPDGYGGYRERPGEVGMQSPGISATSWSASCSPRPCLPESCRCFPPRCP